LQIIFHYGGKTFTPVNIKPATVPNTKKTTKEAE
jgi:hypothetical protein